MFEWCLWGQVYNRLHLFFPFLAQFIHDSIKNEDSCKKAPFFAFSLSKDILTWSQKTRNFALLFVSSIFGGWVPPLPGVLVLSPVKQEYIDSIQMMSLRGTDCGGGSGG